MPFRYWPRVFIVQLVAAVIFWLNVFPPKEALISTVSPRALVQGISIDYNKHCQLPYGTYVHTHEDTDNSNRPRTVGAIAARPTGNAQGGHYFISLSTGRVLNRTRWTELPMPDDVIKSINDQGIAAGMNPGVWFGDDDDDDNNSYQTEEDPITQGDDAILDANMDRVDDDEVAWLEADGAQHEGANVNQDDDEWHDAQEGEHQDDEIMYDAQDEDVGIDDGNANMLPPTEIPEETTGPDNEDANIGENRSDSAKDEDENTITEENRSVEITTNNGDRL